ncbi:MAG TPA: NAD(P)-binding protein, partial [Actinomycetota bacterium]|nr:NAD(P)-binding protein [Actinomycetota bacterium]
MTELEMAVPVTGSTVWWSTLDREGRERLGRRGELDPTPDVLVVGGGAVGLATAALCRRAGLGRVQVVERAAVIASAASG